MKVRAELRELKWLYENTGISSESDDAAKARIMRALGEWGNQYGKAKEPNQENGQQNS